MSDKLTKAFHEFMNAIVEAVDADDPAVVSNGDIVDVEGYRNTKYGIVYLRASNNIVSVKLKKPNPISRVIEAAALELGAAARRAGPEESY